MSLHRGIIKIGLHYGNRIDTVPFDYELKGHDAKISDTLVSNFDWLKLSSEEKQVLTQTDRKEILLLKNFPEKDILDYAEQLNILINSYECNHVTLRADFFGALIALASINVEELVDNCQVTLHLHNFPPQFIPAKFSKLPESTRCQIVFHSESENNLEKFDSLFQESTNSGLGPLIIKKINTLKFRNSA